MNKEILVQKLLHYFIEEDQRYQDLNIPTNYGEARTLLRGLINMRAPKRIDEDILMLEDKLLDLELKEKCVTDIQDICLIEDKVCIWQGDITTLKIEAIVNAGNSALLGCFIPNHSCIDNAIHTYAGIRLRLACNDVMRGYELDSDKAIITGAYNLPSKYVIHTVGPIVKNHLTASNIKDLNQCYISCLDLARELNIKTIAFPCISTGVFHFPRDKASEIAVHTVRKYLQDYPNSFDKIVFNVFTEEDKECYEQLFESK